MEHVEKTLKSFYTLPYQKPHNVTEGVSVTLYDAGHILGSAIVELTLSEGNEQRTVVFSGDLGHRGAPILRDFTHLNHADLILMESTYGNREHRDWSDTFDEVSEIAEAIKDSPGNVLIPAFSVGRSQMILYMFARYFDEWDLGRWRIFLDSPMAIKATDVYLKYTKLYDETAAAFYEENGPLLSMPNLTFTETADESRQINRLESGAIIVAGSGMMTGGRILHHLKHNIWKPDTHLIISGYQSHGSLGRRIVEGAPTIKLWGERINVAAQVHTVGGLSAHADQNGMLAWYESFEGRPPVLLVHGEPDAADALADKLRDNYGARARPARRGKSTDLLDLSNF